jgi:hypothetical protein
MQRICSSVFSIPAALNESFFLEFKTGPGERFQIGLRCVRNEFGYTSQFSFLRLFANCFGSFSAVARLLSVPRR